MPLQNLRNSIACVWQAARCRSIALYGAFSAPSPTLRIHTTYPT